MFWKVRLPVRGTGFLCFGFVFGLGVLVFIFFKNFVFVLLVIFGITFLYGWLGIFIILHLRLVFLHEPFLFLRFIKINLLVSFTVRMFVV